MKINAYAKINLALEVMDIENGYHRVNNLMVPLALHDEIEMEVSDSIQIEDDPFPMDNIMRKAAELFFQKTKIRRKKNKL
jgi:4-diphosphocytidyl-2C-methyl-D-erythritol kinase